MGKMIIIHSWNYFISKYKCTWFLSTDSYLLNSLLHTAIAMMVNLPCSHVYRWLQMARLPDGVVPSKAAISVNLIDAVVPNIAAHQSS